MATHDMRVEHKLTRDDDNLQIVVSYAWCVCGEWFLSRVRRADWTAGAGHNYPDKAQFMDEFFSHLDNVAFNADLSD